jgi:hypothetical protein
MDAPDGSRHNDAVQPPTGTGSSHFRWANVALALVSILLTLTVVEAGYRVAAGLPVLRLTNWRNEHLIVSAMSEIKAIPDPVLGWTTPPSTYHKDGYTTIELGIRQNFDEKTIRTGGVLAAGDSFTEGWEVKDSESWPAQLERLIEVPVINAGVGSYGADQTVLRAEQLLPIVKPKFLILGFHEVAIDRAGHSVYGAPKPWFDLVNGELRYHAPPSMDTRPQGGAMSSLIYGFRDTLGYSAVADFVLARLAKNFWHSTATDWDYRNAPNDPVEVTCALLRRVKARADHDDIRMLLLTQYYATVITGQEKATSNIRRVSECARSAGIRVVDLLPSLREIDRARPNSMYEYFFIYGAELWGHMTPKGNGHAAHLLATAMRDWLTTTTGSSQAVATPEAPKPARAGGSPH